MENTLAAAGSIASIVALLWMLIAQLRSSPPKPTSREGATDDRSRPDSLTDRDHLIQMNQVLARGIRGEAKRYRFALVAGAAAFGILLLAIAVGSWGQLSRGDWGYWAAAFFLGSLLFGGALNDSFRQMPDFATRLEDQAEKWRNGAPLPDRDA